MTSVETIKMVLKEIDNFVKIPQPQEKLVKIDHFIQEEIEKNRFHPILFINTPYPFVPLDSDLFKKAFSLIFNEILSDTFQASDFKIVLQDSAMSLKFSLVK